MRSRVAIDLGALRRNTAALLRAADGAELWAVVKADGYGHGALDCGRAALDAGATALCVATVGEALPLRAALPDARLIVLGPSRATELAAARAARLELVAATDELPEGVPLHVKLDGGSIVYGNGGTLRQARARFEREYISAVLEQHQGRISEAARALGIQRTNLYRKMRSLKVARERRGRR